MKHQQRPLVAATAPKKNKEVSPWWDFFNNCKDVSDSEESDDISYDYAHHNDMICSGYANIAADSTNGDKILKATSQASHSNVPITPVKSIDIESNQINANDNDGAAGPDTPGTQDSSFSSTETEAPSSSSSLPEDDALEALSVESQSLEMHYGENEVAEECSVTESNNNDSSSVTSNTSSSMAMLLKPKYSTVKQQQVQLLQPVLNNDDAEEQINNNNDEMIVTSDVDTDKTHTVEKAMQSQPVSDKEEEAEGQIFDDEDVDNDTTPDNDVDEIFEEVETAIQTTFVTGEDHNEKNIDNATPGSNSEEISTGEERCCSFGEEIDDKDSTSNNFDIADAEWDDQGQNDVEIEYNDTTVVENEKEDEQSLENAVVDESSTIDNDGMLCKNDTEEIDANSAISNDCTEVSSSRAEFCENKELDGNSYETLSERKEHSNGNVDEDLDGSSTFSNSEDNFIGNIEILPISPLLSTHQRNIRKTAYNLLKRLGEEDSLFDLASVDFEVGEDDHGQQLQIENSQQHQEVVEEVEGLKRHIGECTNMVMELQDSLRNYTNDAINENDIPSEGEVENDREASNDIIEELHAEISTLTSQLEAATEQSEKNAQHIESLEEQLKAALKESSNYLNKLLEYEESMKSLKEAVNQSNLYNEEISKELMVAKKENEELTKKVIERETQTEIDKEDECSTNSSLRKENDEESSVATFEGDSKDLSDALSGDNPVVEKSAIVDGDDNLTGATDIDQDESFTNLDMVFDQAASVVLLRPTLQEHIVSCMKLPMRLISILFSLWVTIIIIRIVLIFSSMLVRDHPSLEDDAFNAPGIY